MATIKLQGGEVILKDGKASCLCCGDCPTEEQSPYGIILSEEQYNNFNSGGNYTMNAILSETYQNRGSCSSNLNGEGVLVSNTLCSFSAQVSEVKCVGGGFGNEAYFNLIWRVFKEAQTNLYKLRYSGYAYCPYLLPEGFCYSVGYFVGDTIDYFPLPYLVNIGSVSLTNRGSNVQFGVWSLSEQGLSTSASATIDITDPTPL
jgi:hypothetical protein